ncbi:GNAT family N-acetyltransferase [Verrucomicrobium spinosum]|uniref:GNAT family N-acetyltransferase n=1 Tax=Verrucomicrobium spinosum TaxID=2736 RepID=UPI0001745ADD|nr:GNAT family N-acetyltransferase [Verrucomicrobium spinosum]
MLNPSVVTIANAYLASHLGCSPHSLFAAPLSIQIHGGDLADYWGAFAMFRHGAAIVSLPSTCADKLKGLLAKVVSDCSPASFAKALASVASVVIGPASIGYATAVIPPEHPVRSLVPGDVVAFHALQQGCDATEWEHGGCVAGSPASGVFTKDQLVAVASYEVWGGTIAHISVITHPDFRGQGLGRSAVAHVARRAILSGLLPQYRTLESNAGSIRIAESLGFQQYATSMAVRLK